MVVVGLASAAGKVTVPFGTFRHDKIDVKASKTHERIAAGVQYCSCINKNAHSLVRMRFLVQHDDQSAPRNVSRRLLVDREAAIHVLCMRAPSSRSGNRVRAQIHCAILLELDILIERHVEAGQGHTRRWTVARRQCLSAQCRRGVVGRNNDHYGDRRACPKRQTCP